MPSMSGPAVVTAASGPEALDVAGIAVRDVGEAGMNLPHAAFRGEELVEQARSFTLGGTHGRSVLAFDRARSNR